MKSTEEFLKGDYQSLANRKLTEDTCKKYGYSVGEHNGKPVHIANFRSNGSVVAQKLRYPNKEFSVRGTLKGAGLFGQHLWEPSKRLVITEGEIDCLSVAQVLGLRWPVVSIPNGSQGAKKSLAAEIEWLEGFDEIVLMFDMDEPGQAAAIECALMFTPGKCKIASLPAKDPSELLQKGQGDVITQCIYSAKTYRPDGIISFKDLRQSALTPISQGLPWPWPKLTELTYGRRYGEVYALGAGTGVGKTDVFTEVIEFTANVLKERCGLVMLEQAPVETAKRVAGKFASKRFHVPDGSWEPEELQQAFDTLAENENIFLYDHFGSTEWENVLSKMKHMVVSEGVKHIFLDHLTALAAESDDERKELEKIMAQIASFAKQHMICFYFISHLATPEGKPHEEGGRVMVRHFKGSRAIGFWSHFMFGLERNQQEEDRDIRSTTTLRVLKDRNTGQATGEVIYLKYDGATGRLHAHVPQGTEMFADDPY